MTKHQALAAVAAALYHFGTEAEYGSSLTGERQPRYDTFPDALVTHCDCGEIHTRDVVDVACVKETGDTSYEVVATIMTEGGEAPAAALRDLLDALPVIQKLLAGAHG